MSNREAWVIVLAVVGWNLFALFFNLWIREKKRADALAIAATTRTPAFMPYYRERLVLRTHEPSAHPSPDVQL